MSTTAYDTFLTAALEMPPEQRSNLASRLLESLEEGPALSEAWQQAITRRAEQIDQGTVPLLEHDTVMQQACQVLADTRKS